MTWTTSDSYDDNKRDESEKEVFVETWPVVTGGCCFDTSSSRRLGSLENSFVDKRTPTRSISKMINTRVGRDTLLVKGRRDRLLFMAKEGGDLADIKVGLGVFMDRGDRRSKLGSLLIGAVI